MGACSLKEVRGGSAWGAGTYAGADGSRQPTDLELRVAKFQVCELACNDSLAISWVA